MSILDHLSARTKLGAPETADDQQYEQDFAGMAFAVIQNRVPRLMPFVLGFEVVERAEDGTKAVGMFGAKLDDHYYYVPAFFVASQVRGMDTLFSTKTNKFVPLKSNWVDHVLDRGAIRLGDTVDDPQQLQRDIERPDFDWVANPQMGGGKYGSAVERPSAEEFSKMAHDAWANLKQVTHDAVRNDPTFQRALRGAFSGQVDKTASSTLRMLFEQQGGPEKVAAFLHCLKHDHTFAETFLGMYDKVADVIPATFAADLLAPKQAAAPVEYLLELLPAEKVAADWTAEERAHALTHGFTVRDRRPAEKRAQLVDKVEVQALENPTRTTRGEILTSGGTYEEALIFAPAGGGSLTSRRDRMVVMALRDRVIFTAAADCIWVRPASTLEAADPSTGIMSEGVEMSSIKPGSAYIFCSPDGKTSVGPLRIGTATGNDGRPEYGLERLYVNKDYANHRSTRGRRRVYDHYEMESAPETLQISPDHSKSNHTGRKLVIPKSWRAVQVKVSEDFTSDAKSLARDADEAGNIPVDTFGDSDAERKAYQAARTKYNKRMREFTPGDRHDVQQALKAANAFPIKLASRRNEVMLSISGKPLATQRPADMYRTLIRNIGLPQKQARYLMDQVEEPGRQFELNVKLAQGWMGVPPQALPEAPQYANDFTGAMDQPYFEQRIPQQNTQPQHTDQSMQPGFNMPTGVESASMGNVQALAPQLQQAAMSGQRDVFDHTVFAGLANVYDLSAVIDGYVPKLLESLDALGRLVFLFHWKNDEWAERYGRHDMAEMEDRLTGVFKQYGDLVLDMKQRAISLEDTDGSLPL